MQHEVNLVPSVGHTLERVQRFYTSMRDMYPAWNGLRVILYFILLQLQDLVSDASCSTASSTSSPFFNPYFLHFLLLFLREASPARETIEIRVCSAPHDFPYTSCPGFQLDFYSSCTIDFSLFASSMQLYPKKE